MLFQNVREKASLAYTTKSSFVKQKLNIFIRCGLEISNYDKALNIIKEQLKNIADGNFTDEDILNAKKYLISGVKAISEEQDTEVVFYIGQEMAKTFIELEKYIENINSVTKEEIVEFAKQVQMNTIYFLKN
jgi:predicted Zn-dependent peptidase